MAKQLGPTFGDEVITAGLGELIGWGPTDDTISNRENLTAGQNATLDGVIAAHDPSKQVVPEPVPANVVLFDHENRLRVFEGVPPISLGEFVQKNGL
jgi:hypothetical protein